MLLRARKDFEQALSIMAKAGSGFVISLLLLYLTLLLDLCLNNLLDLNSSGSILLSFGLCGYDM